MPLAVAIVGHGLAGRSIHAPLIRRQPGMSIRGIVARDPAVRAEAGRLWGAIGYGRIEEALADPLVELIVIATPHDTHTDLAVQALEAGKHCVVDKVMALSTSEADRMIRARDTSGRMLSVFHNRRWDWDYLTVRSVLAEGLLGRPFLFESAVCRWSSPRTWRGRSAEAGTVLHDWGAHLIDQALQLGLGACRRVNAWISPAPWAGVDSGGHGRITLEFDDGIVFQIDCSRACPLDRPRWFVLGAAAALEQRGIDPQEQALRSGDLDAADQPPDHQARIRAGGAPSDDDRFIPSVRGSWDSYYANIVDHLEGRAPLLVSAEQAREVVRVLDAAVESAHHRRPVEGHWTGA